MKVKQIKNLLFSASFVFFGLLSGATLISGLSIILSPLNTIASGSCTSKDGDETCVNATCDALRGHMDATECLQRVSECSETSFVNGITGVWGTTGSGSCANALLSCFEQARDKSACKDNNIIARVTGCSNGNVGADANADGECGIDNAIEANNKELIKNGVYASNKGLKEEYLENHPKEACTGLSAEETRKCEDEVKKQIEECYTELGGTATPFTDEQLNECMGKKAQRQSQCEASGSKYTWDPATNKCVPPAPPPDPCKDHGGVDPNDPNKCADGTTPDEAEAPKGDVGEVKGRCGQARVNILACGDEEGNVAISNILKIGVIVLSTLVGAAALGGLVWSSLQYARASDNQSVTSDAKNRIMNIVIGLFLYGFIIAIANWLVPGGVL